MKIHLFFAGRPRPLGAGRNCVPLFDYYARNVIIIGMTQKVCIERVEVRGAAPYLGMCVDTVGREMPVWSDNP